MAVFGPPPAQTPQSAAAAATASNPVMRAANGGGAAPAAATSGAKPPAIVHPAAATAAPVGPGGMKGSTSGDPSKGYDGNIGYVYQGRHYQTGTGPFPNPNGSAPATAAAAPAAPGAIAPVTTATAGPNAAQSYATQQAEALYGSDMGVPALQQQTDLGIKQAASGTETALTANEAQRGITGTGASDLLSSRLAGQTEEDIARANTGIANAATGQKAALLNIIGGIGGTEASDANAATGLGIQQESVQNQAVAAANANAVAEQNAQLAQEMAAVNALSSMDPGLSMGL